MFGSFRALARPAGAPLPPPSLLLSSPGRSCRRLPSPPLAVLGRAPTWLLNRRRTRNAGSEGRADQAGRHGRGLVRVRNGRRRETGRHREPMLSKHLGRFRRIRVCPPISSHCDHRLGKQDGRSGGEREKERERESERGGRCDSERRRRAERERAGAAVIDWQKSRPKGETSRDEQRRAHDGAALSRWTSWPRNAETASSNRSLSASRTESLPMIQHRRPGCAAGGPSGTTVRFREKCHRAR